MMPDCLPKLAVPVSTEADPSSGPCGWVDSSEEKCPLGARSLALQSARWRAHSATNLMETLSSFFVCEQKLFAIFFVRFLKVTVIAFVTMCSGQVKQEDGYTAKR